MLLPGITKLNPPSFSSEESTAIHLGVLSYATPPTAADQYLYNSCETLIKWSSVSCSQSSRTSSHYISLHAYYLLNSNVNVTHRNDNAESTESNKTRYRCFKHQYLAVTDSFTQGLVTLPHRTQTSTRPKTANQIHCLH